MSHARVEELSDSDSDPDIDDPSSYLPHSDQSIISPAHIPSSSTSNRSLPTNTDTTASSSLFQQPIPNTTTTSHSQNQALAREKIKSYQTIYPIYFDSTRTRSQGRRVSSSLAIPNPLAWNLLAAARHAFSSSSDGSNGQNNVQLAFEPDKTHPKDWANPGRIRVQLYDPDTQAPVHPRIKCKAALYTAMGKYLVSHPTQPSDPLQLKIQNLPVPDKFTETEVQKPRGWKMGSVLPVHSPAVSGGGVKDDFFKEAMEEMRQAQAAGHQLPGMPGGAGGAGGMPDMSALQSMMGGMGGLGGLMGGGGGGSGGGGGEASGGKKKKDKKK